MSDKNKELTELASQLQDKLTAARPLMGFECKPLHYFSAEVDPVRVCVEFGVFAGDRQIYYDINPIVKNARWLTNYVLDGIDKIIINLTSKLSTRDRILHQYLTGGLHYSIRVIELPVDPSGVTVDLEKLDGDQNETKTDPHASIVDGGTVDTFSFKWSVYQVHGGYVFAAYIEAFKVLVVSRLLQRTQLTPTVHLYK